MALTLVPQKFIDTSGNYISNIKLEEVDLSTVKDSSAVSQHSLKMLCRSSSS